MLSAREPERRGSRTDSISSNEIERAESLDCILDVSTEAMMGMVSQSWQKIIGVVRPRDPVSRL